MPSSRSLVFLAAVLVVSIPGFAQTQTQQIDLVKGWNSVFLEVEPPVASGQDNPCDAIFGGLDAGVIESVWAWNGHFRTVQRLPDASALLPDEPGWLVYYPQGTQLRFLTSLFGLHSGRAYLINATKAASLSVQGAAQVLSITWLPNSYNLSGFAVDPAAGPKFGDFFAPATALASGPFYRLDPAGVWTAVQPTDSTPMKRSEAFWVYSMGSSTYQGPIHVTLEQTGGISFGDTLTETTVKLKNETAGAQTFTLSLVQSAPGTAPLQWWNDSYADAAHAGWQDFTGSVTLSLVGSEEKLFRLAIQRSKMTAPYVDILQVSDGKGTVDYIPLSASPLQSPAKAAMHIRAGLWVGTVTVSQVSDLSRVVPNSPFPEGDGTMQAAASEFSFRIMMHVDASGNASLLQHVTQLFNPGTYKPASSDPGAPLIVDTPGEYVLITKDDLLDKYQGMTLADGKLVGRRISCPAFAFSQPLAMTGGTFPAVGETPTLSVEIDTDFDDPLNPFKHKYHPDHNNYLEDYSAKLTVPTESYSFKRIITLGFTSSDPTSQSSQSSGWGDNQLGGNYDEKVTGIFSEARPINVHGVFRVYRASQIAVLDPTP